MRTPRLNQHARVERITSRSRRFAALSLAAVVMVGCSTQPMTVKQELTAAAVAGAIGAGSGLVFAASANQSYPASILIGAAGMAGVVLLYEEIKREAAMESMPPVPTYPDSTPEPKQNP